MGAYLTMGAVAATITFLLTPAVLWFARRVGAIDHPSDRKVHAQPTPTLGGIALFGGILGALALAALQPQFRDIFTQSSEVYGIAAGAIVIFCLGVVDDFKELPAPAKFAGQIFAAGILFLSGVKMQFVLLPNGTFFLSDDVSVLVTVIWMVAMINAVNLVDGLDGLAAGLVAIAAAAFFVYIYPLAETGALLATSAPLVAIIVVGAALGFLRYNFHPARIFMGDSGSMLLGLVLGAATVAGVGHAPLIAEVSTTGAFLAYFPLFIPLMVLAIPLADSVFAVIRRARKRRNVFQGDKEHLHHRLMDLGHGHRQAVIVMYIWSALAAGAALGFTFLDRSDVIFALPIAVGAIVLYTLFPVLTKAIQDKL
ncbi:MAG TPA: MraY family glycosyltransferase [Actinomycetota bacterium]|nr:MraY family glycosyltransferase [Actinomycetota bacterium]